MTPALYKLVLEDDRLVQEVDKLVLEDDKLVRELYKLALVVVNI